MRAMGASGFKPAPFRQTVLPLSRALHLLQYFGHFSPSVLPAVLASFHSAAHLRWRSRAAIWLTVGSRFAAPSRFLDLRLPVSSPSAGVDACATTMAPSRSAGVSLAKAGPASAKTSSVAAMPKR